jgi:L-fuculose-phosphate aldolase
VIDVEQARTRMVAAGVRLGARGLVVASEGNLSLRLDDDLLLITPSGLHKDDLRPEDLLIVPISVEGDLGSSAEHGGLTPSSDLPIHRFIYAARSDVQAVIHAHLPVAMALTVAGLAPDPSRLPETALLLPRLPVVPFAAAGSMGLAMAVAAALSDLGPSGDDALPNAVLLERHGAIAVGDDLATAGDRLELAELLCRVHRDAVLLEAAADRARA